MKNLIFVSRSVIPSRRANTVNVLKMCENFSKLGLNVKLYAKFRTNNYEYIKKYYSLESNIEIVDINTHVVNTVPILNQFVKILMYLYLSFKINLYEKSSFIYSRDIYSLALLNDINFCYEAHSPPKKLIPKVIFKLFSERKNFIKMVCISKSLSDIFCSEENLISREKVIISHDGADLFNYSNYRLIKNRVAIGYAGSLYKGRGIGIIKYLAENLPDINFFIVGGTESNHKSMIDKNIQNLHYITHKPHSLLLKLISNFDILLAPYQKDLTIRNIKNTSSYRWMSPLKIFEYMSLGKPIVCSDFKVIREVLINGENSLLVPYDDKKAWLQSVRKLINSEKYRQLLGNKARLDFEKNFTWSQRASFISKSCGFQI